MDQHIAHCLVLWCNACLFHKTDLLYLCGHYVLLFTFLVGESVLEATKTDEDSAMSSSAPSVVVPTVTDPPPPSQESQQPHLSIPSVTSIITTSDAHKQPPSVNKASSPPPTATSEDVCCRRKSRLVLNQLLPNQETNGLYPPIGPKGGSH